MKRHMHTYGRGPMVISVSTDGVGSTTFITGSYDLWTTGVSGGEATINDDGGDG